MTFLKGRYIIGYVGKTNPMVLALTNLWKLQLITDSTSHEKCVKKTFTIISLYPYVKKLFKTQHGGNPIDSAVTCMSAIGHRFIATAKEILKCRRRDLSRHAQKPETFFCVIEKQQKVVCKFACFCFSFFCC